MTAKTRREFLSLGASIAAGAAAAPLLAGGCAGRGVAPVTAAAAPAIAAPVQDAAAAWLDFERPLVFAERDDFDLVVRGNENAGVLRLRAREAPPGMDLPGIAARMEWTMRAAGGVGIAGPQVGLSLRVATLMLDYKTDDPEVLFAVNPVIVERSDESLRGYEGCLSIPGVGGMVRRNTWIRVRHHGPGGEPLETEAEGYNAVLWQHELDHLDGVLYVDRLQGELMPMDEVRRLRRELEEAGEIEPAGPAARRQASLEGACVLLS